MEGVPEKVERPLVHAMTCDVEDYFQVSAFEQHVDRSDWSQFDCRIPRNVDRILELFEEAGAKGTFFTLGWVAQHHPNVVRKIADAGHEIASHGMEHRRVWQQSAEEFREDASATKKLLEDVAGASVVGYRAASWSIDQRTPWAHDVLAEAGYQYSSSIYPIKHDHFGVPDAPTRPHGRGDASLLEIPASVARVFGRNLPASGGGYFRLYPLAISTWLIDRIQASDGSPYIFYFHPWEMDAAQPRMQGVSAKTRFRHYLNLESFPKKLAALLARYEWERMDNVFLREAQDSATRS